MNRMLVIDLVKSLAILSVIVLHTLSKESLLLILAPYHIWQSVPIFFIVAAYLFGLRTSQPFRNHYQLTVLMRRFLSLLVPFGMVLIIQFVVFCLYKQDLFEAIHLVFQKKIGPGSYFIVIFIQFILIAPVICNLVRYKYGIYILFFLSVALEYFCKDLHSEIYRNLVVRYVFAIGLGFHYAFYNRSYRIRFATVTLFLVSAVYIWLRSYIISDDFLTHPTWRAQHYLAYFYTVCLFAAMLRIGHAITLDKTPFVTHFAYLGRISYSIFCFQMIYFSTMTLWPVYNDCSTLIKLCVNLFACVVGGIALEMSVTFVRIRLNPLNKKTK